MSNTGVLLTGSGSLTSDLPAKKPPYPGEALSRAFQQSRLREEQKSSNVRLASGTPFETGASIDYPNKNIYVAPISNTQQRGIQPMGSRGSVSLPIQGERVFEIGEEIRRPFEARVNKLLSQYEVPPEQEKPLLPIQTGAGASKAAEQTSAELDKIKQAVRNELSKRGGANAPVVATPTATPIQPATGMPQSARPRAPLETPVQASPAAPIAAATTAPIQSQPSTPQTQVQSPPAISIPIQQTQPVAPTTSAVVTPPIVNAPPPSEMGKLFSEAEKLQAELSKLGKEFTAAATVPTQAPVPTKPLPVQQFQVDPRDKQINQLVIEKSDLLKQLNNLQASLQSEVIKRETARDNLSPLQQQISILGKEKVNLSQQVDFLRKELAKHQQIDVSAQQLTKEFEDLRARVAIAEGTKTADAEQIKKLEALIGQLRQTPHEAPKLVETITPQEVTEKSKEEPAVKVVKPSLAVGKMAPSLTSAPNVINGIVRDTAGLLLSNIIIVVKDGKGDPVRALKTNKIGQFAISTPLPNGTYILELESPNHNFNNIQVELEGEVLPPIEIKAN
jgi:hypothetical protein